MKLFINKWFVAYRRKTDVLLTSTDAFSVIPGSYKECYADPFLFEYQGTTYLFAEHLDYKINRGTISCAVFDKDTKTFGAFKEIITEPFHLSYPIVFQTGNDIFLMPEANESGTLYAYKAIDFPEKWEKAHIIMDGVRLVDTTPFLYGKQMYAVTKDNRTVESPMLLLKIDPKSWHVEKTTVVTDDVSVSRPGGNIIQNDGQYYLVTQDCKDDYGTALTFLHFTIDADDVLHYEPIRKITPEQIQINGVNSVAGIHTYNTAGDIEVIDFKAPTLSLYRVFWKLMRRLRLYTP